jgi:NADH-quinone oxidoreductase subunit E
MYNLKPVGKCLLEVCQTGPCMLNGADDLVAHFEKKLNIKVGETTEDGMFRFLWYCSDVTMWC